jgi:AcrR family transcriptional regulator
VSAHRQRPRPEASRDPLRERIEKALISLVGNHGYEVTTEDAICGLAEISSAQFTSRFVDKEECFLELYDAMRIEFGERILRAYRSRSGWHDRVWAAGWAAIEFLREDPVRARLFIIEVNSAGVEAVRRRHQAMRTFAELLDTGRGEIEDPDSISRATAEMVTGAIYYTIRDRILDGSVERGDDFLAELVYLAVLPYLGRRRAESELKVHALH